MSKMSIRDEDPRLVSLAIALTRKDSIDFPVGVPSPDQASTPGCYFGAIRALKYLCSKGVLTPEQVEKLLQQDNLKFYLPKDKTV